MTKKNSMTKLVLVLVAAAAIILSMTGCDTASTAAAHSNPPAVYYNTGDDPAPATGNAGTVKQPEDKTPIQESDPVSVDNAESKKPVGPMNSVESISAIGDLVGNYSLFTTLHHSVVDIDNSHNPYDLTWAYGEQPYRDMPSADKLSLITSAEWGSFYDSYVDACDWSLVFDADYYMAQFPMLAYLYQYDEDLLLEHFQTTGVHEGRQGIATFNVSAYMENCSPAVKNAFGDNYECYYFYWMLNQDTEKAVVTTGNSYPTWRTVQLSYYQNEEVENINAYRKDVGVNPVSVDPEMIAFASYRAWHDAKYGIHAHDSLRDKDVEDCIYMLGLSHISENTCKYEYPSSIGQNDLVTPYARYFNSESHYKAMVEKIYVYVGVTNIYLSEYTERTLAEFDLFTESTPFTSR